MIVRQCSHQQVASMSKNSEHGFKFNKICLVQRKYNEILVGIGVHNLLIDLISKNIFKAKRIIIVRFLFKTIL